MKKFFQNIIRLLKNSRDDSIYTALERIQYYAKAIQYIQSMPIHDTSSQMALCNIFGKFNIRLSTDLGNFPELKRLCPKMRYDCNNFLMPRYSQTGFWFRLDEEGKQQRLKLLQKAIRMTK